MDTRSKILTPEGAAEVARALLRSGGRLKIVTGYFDVLLASHARELRQVVDSTENAALMVVLLPPPEPILGARARAEMVAALAVVDYVVTAEKDNLEALLAALNADETVRFEAADMRRIQQLIEHVHWRQTG